MSPIGMSPRRISQDCEVLGYDFKKNDRVFFMFGAANRDLEFLVTPDIFDFSRNTGPAIPFGANPHFCAGAAASRVLISEVALPQLFKAFPNLELTDEVNLGGGFPWPVGSGSKGKLLRTVKYANRTTT